MRPDLIVTGSVILPRTPQLSFVEHDQVVESFAPNRSDESLDVAAGSSCRMQMVMLMRSDPGFG
jgi:hypothetical protein